MILSMVPIGAPTAHAATYQQIYAQCIEEGGTNAGCSTFATSEINAQNRTQQPTTTNKYDPAKPSTDDFGCKVGTLFTNCVAALVYWAGPGIASPVAYIGAYFFSIVVQLSLNSTAYALDFLSNGWTTVRDIANMAFIFILIYIALTVMLFAETAGMIKQLALVIVIALLVNFSFFFTRLIIDTGNILALQFYNAIPTEMVNEKPATINGVKDLSASIMGAVQLQKLYGSDAFTKASNACGKGSNGSMCGLIVSTIVYVSVAAMFWMLFFAFLQVGIKFLLRIIGLWFLIIASPLAFVAKTIPKTAGYFDQWFKKLIEFSIYPAIFLFMFLILTGFTKQLLRADQGGGSILDAAMNSGTGASDITGIGAAIANVGIRMGFVLALMYVALHVSEWMVKEGSAMASKVTGWSTGKAFGAIGWGGRNTIGWAGQRVSETAAMRNWAAKGGILGRTLWRGTGALGRSSFDTRGIPGARTALGVLGGDVITSGRVDVGEASKKNYKESYDARIERRDKESALLKPSEGQLYKAVGGVVKGLSKEQKQDLMNAAGTYAQAKEDRTNGDATSADVKRALDAYKAVLKELNIKDKIKKAKEDAGSKNAKIYAGAITTKDWRNAWGATSGVPFWIGKADKEAAAKIRGSKTDADQIKNVLSTLKFTVDENYETPEPPPKTPGGGDRGGGGGGGGGGAAIPPPPPVPARAPGAGPQPASPPSGWQFPSSGRNVTATLSKDDRELFRKAIKTMKATNENSSQGFANIARQISNGANDIPKPANDNKGSGTKTPANDNAENKLNLDENKAA